MGDGCASDHCIHRTDRRSGFLKQETDVSGRTSGSRIEGKDVNGIEHGIQRAPSLFQFH